MKLIITAVVMLMCAAVSAQTCQSGKLDPRVSKMLKDVLHDLMPPTISVEQVRDVKIELPATFPEDDVRYLKATADSIPLQIYNPLHTSGLPIIISFHPGGFVTPILPFMKYDFWRQAKAYRAIVFAVDYRIAPEHPFPAAVDDAYHAFKWIQSHGQEFGGDTSRIIVMGLSAGGNLAAVTCQKAKEDGLHSRIKLQVLNCPSTDDPRNHKDHNSYAQYSSGYFLTRAFCQYYIRVYAPNAASDNPDIAPLKQKDVSKLPPALIVTAEFDPLRDEGYDYAERLRKAGVPLLYRCFPGQIHCLVGLPSDAEELKEYDRLVLSAMDQFVK